MLAASALRIAHASCSLPKPGRLHWQNEDAAFCKPPFFGVFDGVSAAPASRDFSQKMASAVARDLGRGSTEDAWPGAAKNSLAVAMKSASGVAGASTASLLRFDTGKQLLQSYNLGDSGYLLYSPSSGADSTLRLSARSSPMKHDGGVPYQLAGSTTTSELFSDSPNDGRSQTHPLQAGQVAVLHTDGLLDNLPMEEVTSLVVQYSKNAAGLARALAARASQARAKPDDVTVVVVTVAPMFTGRQDGQGLLQHGRGRDSRVVSGATSQSRRELLSSARLAMLGGAVSSATAGPALAAEPAATIPVMEVVRVYGRLAGSECFGKAVPTASGASCQLTLASATRALDLESRGGVSEDDFAARLATRGFRWPLKPWGVANNSPSNGKTVTVPLPRACCCGSGCCVHCCLRLLSGMLPIIRVPPSDSIVAAAALLPLHCRLCVLPLCVQMNKSAETALFMQELERRGLHDPRNPTGPLPTSLRPKLDQEIEAEGIDAQAASIVFRALMGSGGEGGQLTVERLERTFRAVLAGEASDGSSAALALDYYSFQALIAQSAARVVWPQPN